NRRTSKSRGLLFLRLIEQAVITVPISYKEILKNHGA
ncbi:MAG: IS1595 family transposase, partial [Desulfobacula sp.]|nr:IS1595 family transposase [Desulfobacula sp.]MCD4736755.1 IS1595 family transposase [Bacteroidales bacterium]